MNLRALRYCFCPVHNATEMFRDNVCLSCEREGLIKTPKPKPEGSWVNTPIGHHRSSVWKRKGHGPSLTVKGQSASQRNRDRIEKALSDPRVVASRQEGEGA